MGIFLAITMVMSAISTAFGVATSIAGANAKAAAQKEQAQMQANSLKAQAEQEEQNQIQRSLVGRRENARKLAAAEAAYGASGVTLQGTPTLALAGMAEENELSMAMEEAASGQKRRLLLTDAHNTLVMADKNARLTKKSGLLDAIGTGLSGAASLAGMSYTGYKNGDIKL